MVLNRLLRAGEARTVRRLGAIADYVDTFAEEVEALSDAELRAKTQEFRDRYADGESLDDLLGETFAVVREGARRTLGQYHYRVQLMGGAALHLGNVAEMRTGEGKTLVSTLPAYLNAIAGEGVHVVTTNDYLARRDSEWMGRVHRFLGLEVGAIYAEMPPDERRAAYAADITYGTNNEFGFDYLRDNMAWSKAECVQRGALRQARPELRGLALQRLVAERRRGGLERGDLLDDALSHMELVGHDFFLFSDKSSGRPSVVYRRRGYDYGVISLV